MRWHGLQINMDCSQQRATIHEHVTKSYKST